MNEVDVSSWEGWSEETLGARDKEWLTPVGEVDRKPWLFKLPRASGLPEWAADLRAEIMASRIAVLLDVPAAEVRLARRHGRSGVISRSIREDGETLFHGNELLSARDSDYDATRRGRSPGYTLVAIAEALAGYHGSEDGLTAFESFAGYLVFDALIANTDRHHENWAVRSPTGALAPSYDHGASLGFNVPPARRGDVEAAALGGVSRHFADAEGKMPLVDVAAAGLALAGDRATRTWLERVERLERSAIEAAAVDLPAWLMSDGARTFVVDLVMTNKRRLLR